MYFKKNLKGILVSFKDALLLSSAVCLLEFHTHTHTQHRDEDVMVLSGAPHKSTLFLDGEMCGCRDCFVHSSATCKLRNQELQRLFKMEELLFFLIFLS